MRKNNSKPSTLQQLGKQSRSLRFGEFFARFPNLRRSQPHFEVVIATNQGRSAGAAREDAVIFGASLHDILDRSSFTTKGGLCVPYVLHRLFSEISRKGLRSEGLFRLSGSAPKILQLEALFSKGPEFGKNADLTSYDVHTLAGAFKKLLRSIPEPVIPHNLHVYYLNGFHKSASDEQNLALLSSLGHRMDRQHFDLLKYIIAVAAYVESEKEANKMTAEALAIVLAPTCTGLDGIINRLPANTNPLSCSLGRVAFSRSMSSNNVLHLSVVKDLEHWTALFQFMIANHEELLRNWTGLSGGAADKESIQPIDEKDTCEAEIKVEELPQGSLSPELVSTAENVSTLYTDFRLSFEDFVLPELTVQLWSAKEPQTQAFEGTDEDENNLHMLSESNELSSEETQSHLYESTSEDDSELYSVSDSKECETAPVLDEENFNKDEETILSVDDSLQNLSLESQVDESQTDITVMEEFIALSKSQSSSGSGYHSSPKEDNSQAQPEEESNYRQLLRKWKSREIVDVSKAPERRGQKLAASFTRSGRFERPKVTLSSIGSPHHVALRPVELNSVKIDGAPHSAPLTDKPLTMNKYPSRQSMDSGIYSADNLSLSDL